jgi:hypothetical protein
MKDPEWVQSQITKGRLKSGYKEAIVKLMPILEAVYPGRWDIQFDTELKFTSVFNTYTPVVFNEAMHNSYVENHSMMNRGNEAAFTEHIQSRISGWLSYIENTYEPVTGQYFEVPTHLTINDVYIVIHFPESTISNSEGESLLIKDMFTKTKLFPNGTIGTSLYGARSTYTIAEMTTGYIHSHLKSIKWKELQNSPTSRITFGNFCLGESDLITFMQLYNGNQDLGNFESYLYMLQTIVSWESTEGGPHIRMKDTVQKSLDVPDVTTEHCEGVLARLIRIRYEDNCNIDWVFRDNKYTIVDNEKFEDFLRSAYTMFPGIPVAVYKEEAGRYFVPSTITSERIQVRQQDFIPFRGQKFQLKVEGQLKLVDKHKWYINPKIKQYVKSKFESICNKAETKKYSLEWINQHDNNRRVSQQG